MLLRLVIDTNRIMAGLLRESTSRRIILHDHFSFFAPDYIETELFRHHAYLVKKSKMAEPDFDETLRILLSHVTLVAFEDFEEEYPRAQQIMEPVDVDDSPFLAVGLALRIGGIWTEDRHFLRQDLLKVYTTGDLIAIM
jgi:predicted nucleic acid-binding protein